jgi:WD40 repeat protein
MQRHGLLALGGILWLATNTLWGQVANMPTPAKPALPDGAVARLGVHRLRVPATIFDAAFSQDQRTFVVVFLEQKKKEPNVILFDVATGLPRKRLDIFTARHLAVAKDNPLMVLDSTKGFELWDLAAEKFVRRWGYPELAYNPSGLAISPDGTLVVAGAIEKDKAIILRWDATTGKALPSLYPAANAIYTISFSSDGSKFFTASSPSYTLGPDRSEKNLKVTPGEIIVWDAKTGKKLAQMPNRHDFVVFSPDGTKIARTGRNDQKIEVVTLAVGRSPDGSSPAPATTKAINEIAARHSRFDFTPDSNQLLIQANPHLMFLWNIAENTVARTFEGQFYSQRHSARFTQDGRTLAVMLEDGWPAQTSFVRFFDVGTGKQIRFSSGHPGTVNGLAYSPDGRLLATFSNDTLLVFDPKTGEELRRWVGHKSSVEQIAFSPDGKLLASASVDGTIAFWETIAFWDPATGKERRRLTATNSVASIAFTRDGSALLGVSTDGALRSWDVAKGQLLRSHDLPATLSAPLISPGGRFVAYFQSEAGGRRTDRHNPFLYWMHARTGKTDLPIDLQRKPVNKDEGFRPEGTIAYGFAFSPDGKLLVTSDSLQTFGLREILSDHTVRVWETATRKEILRFSNNPVGTHLLAFSPDGRILAHGIGDHATWGHGTDKTIILRDIAAAQTVTLGGKDDRFGPRPETIQSLQKMHRPIGGHLGSITCMTFSPDGKFLATGGSDQVVYIWRVEDFFKRPAFGKVAGDVAGLWSHLADADPGKAYRAIAQMERKPKETLELLRKQLRPAPKADEQAIAQHLRDLASASFVVRQQAYLALEKAGEQAAHLVEQTVKNPPNVEVKRRLELLLEKLQRPLDEPGQIRLYRALTLLERIGTPPARQLLEELAEGAPSAWLTVEARYALQGMAK